MDYILRINDLDGGEAGLRLFSDPDELSDYLDHLILTDLYDGTGPLVAGIWFWDDEDNRHKLELYRVKAVPEGDDWEDHYYQVRRRESPRVPLLSFTVSVDLRQVQ